MSEKKKYVPCPFCRGTGKIVKLKSIRRKCADCGDYNHGCFGSGKSNGLGHIHCVDTVKC